MKLVLSRPENSNWGFLQEAWTIYRLSCLPIVVMGGFRQQADIQYTTWSFLVQKLGYLCLCCIYIPCYIILCEIKICDVLRICGLDVLPMWSMGKWDSNHFIVMIFKSIIFYHELNNSSLISSYSTPFRRTYAAALTCTFRLKWIWYQPVYAECVNMVTNVRAPAGKYEYDTLHKYTCKIMLIWHQHYT